jgi:hypothetical protein
MATSRTTAPRTAARWRRCWRSSSRPLLASVAESGPVRRSRYGTASASCASSTASSIRSGSVAASRNQAWRVSWATSASSPVEDSGNPCPGQPRVSLEDQSVSLVRVQASQVGDDAVRHRRLCDSRAVQQLEPVAPLPGRVQASWIRREQALERCDRAIVGGRPAPEHLGQRDLDQFLSAGDVPDQQVRIPWSSGRLAVTNSVNAASSRPVHQRSRRHRGSCREVG